jgi:hypothetical protein
VGADPFSFEIGDRQTVEYSTEISDQKFQGKKLVLTFVD